MTVAGREVALSDALTGGSSESVPIRLQAGLHPIVVDYHYFTGPRLLQLTCQGPDMPREVIDATMLFRDMAE